MARSRHQVLDEAFKEAGSSARNIRDRAAALGDDGAALSRILTGKQALTQARARKWAAKLFPSDTGKAEALVSALLAASDFDLKLGAGAFFESIVAEGGAVPAERIKDLFLALQSTENPIICIEYRDPPRAGRETKYEQLGEDLGAAISGGITVAMFQPFGGDENLPLPDPGVITHSFEAVVCMRRVRDGCRVAYSSFVQAAKRIEGGRNSEQIERNIKLYERSSKGSYFGSGLQGKMFFIQWQESNNSIRTTHRRIMQWLSTPLRDLLVYRGQQHILPEAIRDTFFPVPHYFEFGQGLPDLSPGKAERVCEETRKASVTPYALPQGECFWATWEPKSR